MESSDVLLFFLLGLLYFVSFLFALLRCVALFRHPLVWKQTKLFYVWILIQTLLRTASFTLAMCDVESTNFDITYLILNIPDSLFISAYLILFWQLVSVYVLTHVSTASALIRGIPTKRMKMTAQIVIAVNCIWLALEAILYIFVILKLCTSSEKDMEMAIIDIVLPLLILSVCIYLQFRYSGVPYKSRSMRLLLKLSNRVTLIWSVCRLLRGALGLYAEFGLKMSMIHELMDYSNPEHVLASIIYIAILLVSEVLCYFLVLDYGFVGKFLFTVDERTEMNTSGVVTPPTQGQSQRPLVAMTNSTFMHSSDIEESEEIPARRHALGQVFKGTLNGQLIAVRKISFPRMNTYVFEEFLDEVEALKCCEFRYVLPLLGGCFDQPSVRVIMPYILNGSLYQLIHERKEALSHRDHIRISREVCLGMLELYAEDRPHGHLTSHNILLDKDGAKIADVGLHKLKKFASVVTAYTNKGAWTSPEQLSHRSKSVAKVKASDDVYSFGVILWEMVTGEEPFPGVTLDRLREMVAGQHLRPEIPARTEEGVSQLIRSCWNREPGNRPTFDSILTSLNRLSDA